MPTLSLDDVVVQEESTEVAKTPVHEDGVSIGVTAEYPKITFSEDDVTMADEEGEPSTFDIDKNSIEEVNKPQDVYAARKQIATKELGLMDKGQGKDFVGEKQDSGFIKVTDVKSEMQTLQEKKLELQEKIGKYGITYDVPDLAVEPTLAVLDIVPHLATVGATLGAAFKGYRLMNPLSKQQLAIAKSWADKDPQLATDMLETVYFAKKNNLDMPAELWESESTADISNTLLKTKMTNMKDRYKGIEYDTLKNVIRGIYDSPTSNEEIAVAFRKSMDEAYNKYDSVAKKKWQAFGERNDLNTVLSKGGQESLMRDIDEATKGAPSAVNRFLKDTIETAKKDSKLEVKNLEEEAQVLYNKVIQYNRKNLSKDEVKIKKALQARHRAKLREIALAENEMNKQPLDLNDLVEARKLMNNKLYVQGGAISTKNKLERRHIEAASKIIEEKISSMASPETLQLLEEARGASRDTFNTFGHNMSGKNLGVETNISGKILNENEIGVVRQFETELQNNNYSIALTKFKEYKKLLGKDNEALNQAKRSYAEKILGLDLTELSKLNSLEAIKLDPKKLQDGLKKALGSTTARNLTKEIVGEQGFKDLIAIRKLDELISQKLPGGYTTWGKELTSAYDGTLMGMIPGTLKLLKGITWDVVTYGITDKGGAANRQIIKTLQKELGKKEPNPGIIQRTIDKWDVGVKAGAVVGAATTSEANDDNIIDKMKSGEVVKDKPMKDLYKRQLTKIMNRKGPFAMNK